MNRVRRCECCGQPIIPEDDGIALTPTQRRIFLVLKRRGAATGGELRDIVWADDPNGGPESLSCLYVHMRLLKARLLPHGLVVRKSRWRGYRIDALTDGAA